MRTKFSTDYSFELNFKGYELEVHGTYTPAENDTRDTPGCSHKFSVDKVKLMDADSDVVPDDVKIGDLEDFILDKKFD